MSARATEEFDGDLRAARVYEPAAGSARQLLQLGARSLRLAGQDIDPVCVKLALVNGALYCPHLTFPLPDVYFQNADASTPERPLEVTPISEKRQSSPTPEIQAAEETPGGGQATDFRQASLFA